MGLTRNSLAPAQMAAATTHNMSIHRFAFDPSYRLPADYLTDSYRVLYLQHCQREGLTATDMLFEDD